MLKLYAREMKNLSRILTVILCCAPFAYAGAAGQVASTSGHDLTSYNPSNANNNQWATMSNGRYDNASSSAKADFGNCNSIILRCAQPKCGNGGCADYDIAQKIVEGCVKSNKTCKKYGEDLIESMSAQLVASANAKMNEQQVALDAARIQAEAQAAAASTAAQSEQMQVLQQQLSDMQQQMADQKEESDRRLQQALEQQAQQQQQALQDMKAAATEAGERNVAGDKGITEYQQDAINREVPSELVTRQTLTGQVYTEVENARTNLNAAKKALNTLFEYGKCDTQGDNCSGPKRVKKWREYAKAFIDSYDKVVEDIYTALMTAQGAGVDLGQVYMMLDNSCNQWAQFACPAGDYVKYTYDNPTTSGSKLPTSPQSCKYADSNNKSETEHDVCKPCTVIKVLTEADDVYQGWVYPEEMDGNTGSTVIGCYSGVLNSSPLFAHMMERRGGQGMVSLTTLQRWIAQTEPDKKSSKENNGLKPEDYCSDNGAMKTLLERASLSKSLKDTDVCVSGPEYDVNRWSNEENSSCPYINSAYAICDVHKRNGGTITDSNEIKEILGLKTTVLSQQLYKQYAYLDATIRRLEIQLKKAMIKVNLDVAAGTDSSSSSGGGSANTQFEDCGAKGREEKLYCLKQHYSKISAEIEAKRCKAVKAQLAKDLKLANGDTGKKNNSACYDQKTITNDNCSDCLQELFDQNQALQDKIDEINAKKSGYNRW